MKSGRPRFTLAGSGTVVHAHHQRAFGATSRGSPACAPRPGPAALPSSPRPCALTCAGARNTAKHPESARATARVIEFLLDDGPAPKSLTHITGDGCDSRADSRSDAVSPS